MSKKDEIIKKEIILQAQKLFQQFGLKKTTMDEIASACGKAKSTLYHYFKSKEEVFDAVIEMEIINLRRHVKEKVEEQKNMIDKISTYIMEFYKEITQKVNIYHIMTHSSNCSEANAKKHFFKTMAFEQSYIVRILEDGFDADEFNGAKREDFPWLAEIFIASFCGIVQYGIEKDGFLDEEKIQRMVDLTVPRIFC